MPISAAPSASASNSTAALCSIFILLHALPSIRRGAARRQVWVGVAKRGAVVGLSASSPISATRARVARSATSSAETAGFGSTAAALLMSAGRRGAEDKWAALECPIPKRSSFQGYREEATRRRRQIRRAAGVWLSGASGSG